MMRLKQKPLVLALAAAGLSIMSGPVLAASVDSINELCGTTVSENTTAGCRTSPVWPYAETLTGDCSIDVADGVGLVLSGCEIDADGYKVEISGGEDATMIMTNGALIGAAKIDIDFEGPEYPDCYNPAISVTNNYDLGADGDGPKDGKITMSTDCGRISISSGSSIVAGNKVDITASGSVYLFGSYVSAGITNDPNVGVIKITAQGDINSTIDSYDTTYEAGDIQFKQAGNGAFVGGF
jgi:hypothetical protein